MGRKTSIACWNWAKIYSKNEQFWIDKCLPLTVRPSTRRGRNRLAQVTQRSEPTLPQYKPLHLYIPPSTLVPDTAETIKAEPTACNNSTNETSYLFVPRHGGSGEPALPLTEVLDRCRKRRGSAAQVSRSVQCWSVSERIGAATEVSRALTKDLLRLKP